MPSLELLEQADRQLTVCNACRYCEGYCAVFPAMELRRQFTEADIVHLANLCFDCRACYNACPYTPPHDYGVNLPQVLSEVRTETYEEYAAPRLLSRAFHGNQLFVALTAIFCVVLVFGSVLAIQGADVLFAEGGGEGSFFEVIPYMAMMLPALALSGFWFAVLGLGAVRFWRTTRASPVELVSWSALIKAGKDALGLAYLKGGGEGCDYPADEKSNLRPLFHHLLVWGVVLDLASTSVAAVYHNLLSRDAPYGYLSAPVILGTVGGILILLGGFGLLWLKRQAWTELASPKMRRLDYAFLVLLVLTSLTGLLLLALRETAAQGTLLTVHLGVVAALYLTLPYGKFAHVVYRYAALVRFHLDEKRSADGVGSG